MDLPFDRLLKNTHYEITESGIRLKVFGIPYSMTEEGLDQAIHFLMRVLERMRILKKEKADLQEHLTH